MFEYASKIEMIEISGFSVTHYKIICTNYVLNIHVRKLTIIHRRF